MWHQRPVRRELPLDVTASRPAAVAPSAAPAEPARIGAGVATPAARVPPALRPEAPPAVAVAPPHHEPDATPIERAPVAAPVERTAGAPSPAPRVVAIPRPEPPPPAAPPSRPPQREAPGVGHGRASAAAVPQRAGTAPPAHAEGEETAALPPPVPVPREEKPSLGSDLVAARRAYTAAIGRYNAAADRFNEIADEYQRVDAYADPDEAARLRVRLEEARGDADAGARARRRAPRAAWKRFSPAIASAARAVAPRRPIAREDATSRYFVASWASLALRQCRAHALGGRGGGVDRAPGCAGDRRRRRMPLGGADRGRASGARKLAGRARGGRCRLRS